MRENRPAESESAFDRAGLRNMIAVDLLLVQFDDFKSRRARQPGPSGFRGRRSINAICRPAHAEGTSRGGGVPVDATSFRSIRIRRIARDIYSKAPFAGNFAPPFRAVALPVLGALEQQKAGMR